MNLLNIRPQPDQLTLNLGTFHFEHKNTEFLFPNSKKWNAEFVAAARNAGIRNELEVYDLSHIQNAIDLVERGASGARRCTSALCSASRARSRQRRRICWPCSMPFRKAPWQVVSIGKYQLPLSTMALALGGNIRVGMEDNVYFSMAFWRSAMSSLSSVPPASCELGREIATPEEAREMMHMPKAPQRRPS